MNKRRKKRLNCQFIFPKRGLSSDDAWLKEYIYLPNALLNIILEYSGNYESLEEKEETCDWKWTPAATSGLSVQEALSRDESFKDFGIFKTLRPGDFLLGQTAF